MQKYKIVSNYTSTDKEKVEEELITQILLTFGFEPTSEQKKAVEVFSRFFFESSPETMMLMRGSAGTGKTSIAAAIVKTLVRIGGRVVLLAPTGRAAKVFSLSSSQQAGTIHRHIYRQRTFGDMTAFNLNVNMRSNTLFIVDEASMIANDSIVDSTFGSGRLLDDLITFVYNGKGCRLFLIGDSAQLPPVGETDSPALSAQVLEGYGLRVFKADLNEVLRQSVNSGILYNATIIRQMITHDSVTRLPVIRFSGFADIVSVSGFELIDQLSDSYRNVGLDDTIVITRSNKRANIYNNGIRNRVLDREEILSQGDYLMVVKNKYVEIEEQSAGTQAKKGDEKISKTTTFLIANGDRVRVRKVRNTRQLYGFTFADLLLDFPDYDNMEMELTTIVDSLATDAPALTQEQSRNLYERVMDDYADIPRKADRLLKLKQNVYFNALQVKYAYAVTCHKAQGGQWAHVYVDQGYMSDEWLTPSYIHWLYTAFTRATETLFLVNWPDNQREKEA